MSIFYCVRIKSDLGAISPTGTSLSIEILDDHSVSLLLGLATLRSLMADIRE